MARPEGLKDLKELLELLPLHCATTLKTAGNNYNSIIYSVDSCRILAYGSGVDELLQKANAWASTGLFSEIDGRGKSPIHADLAPCFSYRFPQAVEPKYFVTFVAFC